MAADVYRSAVAQAEALQAPLPAVLDRRFEALMFDWDGTAVPDRTADASPVRELIERLCALGMEVAVVSGTNVRNVDGQLAARPRGPGRLLLCLNRGSEVFAVGHRGPRLTHRRRASEEEDIALTAAARLTAERLADRGLRTRIVARRLNRRKIDLIPEPAWADPPKAKIGELIQAVQERLHGAGIGGLPDVIEAAREAAGDAGLPQARVTSDVKHVEIGLTDKSDSARWVLRALWERGIGPGLALIAGDEFGPLGDVPGSDSLMLVPESARATAASVGLEPAGVPAGVIHLPGGPEAFLFLLEEQLRRRERGEAPELDPDPGWILTVEGLDPVGERVHEAHLTVADGRIGTTGSPLAAHDATRPAVLAAGVYRGKGPGVELAPCPVWSRLPLDLEWPESLRRALDLRTGLLREDLDTPQGPVSSVRFSSLARPGVVALRAEGPPRRVRWGMALAGPEDAVECGEDEGAVWRRVRGSRGGVAVAAREARVARQPGTSALERVAACATSSQRRPSPEAALRRLRAAEGAGFERLLGEHRSAWARRWAGSGITIEGDPELQAAVRFAQFHLMASVADRGEAAVGARGLTGPGYGGHVFWDSDVFVLPFMAATHPAAARAMLEYRIRRLPQARAAAAALGRRGARFPWESAGTGEDVTPRRARDRTGRLRVIRTGRLEEHIVADVAWAAACYVEWTGDLAFATGPGRDLLVETARYWASRIRTDSLVQGHILGVIGPDEYHEPVDDNAFTNVMARWNLRAAARWVSPEDPDVGRDERQAWLELADRLVDGYVPATGLYEQFTGYLDLEPVVIANLHRRPVAADLLLGPDRVESTQVIKQADVLMLYHMVPREVARGSLHANLAFYEPRTAHGSSLSPGVHSALFARAGRLEEALEWLRVAGRIDLDDVTGTTAGGLHLATMGTVWQALAFGFAGVGVRDGALVVDPRVPGCWQAMEVPVTFRGARVRVRLERGEVIVSADRTVPVSFADAPPVPVGPGEIRVKRHGGGWNP